MALLIMNLETALDSVPVQPTYAIRIRRSRTEDRDFPGLRASPHYVAVKEYIFDDIDPWDKNRAECSVLFSAEIARKMLQDYALEGINTRDLMIHCSRGQNRSPALAVGFNRVFKIGENEEQLIQRYPGGTWWMTNLLLEVAKEMQLLPKESPIIDAISLREYWEDEEG